ncbi:MAG TPA: dihydroorotate dehydrogenase electron transfer subunit [Candidatus Marinimicrobia bacterium]|nr:dihydroorotate dehydrogenase electron transfer subunit [Candidatus Neomarinimicrobiota bacterium]HRS51594.1 dihydroorotate dehydrogenase electron transfer subunit [Candidatus Neomarinimicrobiota bacterium]HRU92328.1 dihydroorotate dehydrogenase electron transfer subunit [Candidatus Neomarinimicrobiota bacterium]
MRVFKVTKVLSNRMVATDTYLMEFAFPEISRSAQPGQFVNFYFSGRPQLFPRPFSIAGVNGENLSILYKKVGCLTEIMTQWQPGQKVRVLGPLGNTFNINHKNHVLIAGGVGLAPLLFLNQKLAGSNYKIWNFVGVRSKDQLPTLSLLSGKNYIATEDGSAEFCGTIVDCFRNNLGAIPRPFSVYACGPEKMLSALWQLSRENHFDLQLSLEKIMACGLGICQGCAIPYSHPSERPLRLVCQDGPVFNANELDME